MTYRELAANIAALPEEQKDMEVVALLWGDEHYVPGEYHDVYDGPSPFDDSEPVGIDNPLSIDIRGWR